jgi:hypothetical protein
MKVMEVLKAFLPLQGGRDAKNKITDQYGRNERRSGPPVAA